MFVTLNHNFSGILDDFVAAFNGFP